MYILYILVYNFINFVSGSVECAPNLTQFYHPEAMKWNCV